MMTHSMDKARKYGWFGHCDSIEAIDMVFSKFGDMKMIPPHPKFKTGLEKVRDVNLVEM